MRVDGNDLAGVVGAFPRTETARTFAELPLSDRISSLRDGNADSALGRFPKRRKWSWLAQQSDLAFARNGRSSETEEKV